MEILPRINSLGWIQRAVGQAAGLLIDAAELRGAGGHLLDVLPNVDPEISGSVATYTDLLRTRTLERVLDK